MKTNPLFQNFDLDTDKEVEGIWVPMGAYDKDRVIRFRIARAGGANKAYGETMAELGKPYRTMTMEQVPDGVIEDIAMGAFIAHVCLGWENVEEWDETIRAAYLQMNPTPEGETPFVPMEHNAENMQRLFKRLPELYKHLTQVAASARTFGVSDEANDTAAGN